MDDSLKLEELYKGMQVIIDANPRSMGNSDIIGTIAQKPTHWTRILVRYFNANLNTWDTHEFMLTHLLKPTKEYCTQLAKHYKRLALEFNELRISIEKD